MIDVRALGLGIAVVAGLPSAAARADHHGMTMPGDPDATSFGVGLSVLAATYSTRFYTGDYEGVQSDVSWASGRFLAGASLAYYRLFENGLQTDGPGDLVLHGQVTLIARGETQAGVLVAGSAPTGDGMLGLGMGHPMLMPAGWGTWHHDRVMLGASLGYSRALVNASSHHDHGVWPLVEPMNMSEISWSGTGELAVSHGVRFGAQLSGGVPVGSLPGHDRVIGALRVSYGAGPFDTSAEVEAGLDGDPFNTRGIVATAMHF